MDKLFKEVNFVFEYREELETFFRPYFEDEQSMYSFFASVFQNDDKDKNPRRIMNQISRFVSLANDIAKIRPGRDPLQVLFLRMLMESMYSLGGSVIQGNIKDFFKDYMSKEGQKYILDNFEFSYLKIHKKNSVTNEITTNDYSNHELSIDDFAQILYKIRGMVVHEGDYWSMQLFARDDCTWITDITIDKQIVTFFKPPKDCSVTYVFHTTLNYKKFICHFVKACINLVNRYIEVKTNEFNKKDA